MVDLGKRRAERQWRWSRTVAHGALALAIAAGAGCGSRKADLRYQAGLEAADAGKPAEARAAWKDALALAPHRVGLRTNLAAFEPDAEVAKRLLEDELTQTPSLAEAKYDRALLDARAGDWDKAAKGFAALAATDPLAADALALCQLAKGEAIAAAAGAPSELGRWVRARAAWARGDAAGAAAALAETQDALLADLRAAFLMRAGDPGTAAKVAHTRALQDLARLAAGQAPSGEPAPAEADPAMAALALRVQAAIASQAGHWSEALTALEGAWALQPSPALRVERALALAWLDRLSEARAEIGEALRGLEHEGAPELVARANQIQQALATAP